MINIQETYFSDMILQLQLSLPYFKQESLQLSISYSPFRLPLQILLLHSYGVSIAMIKQLMLLGSPLYLQEPSNISTLMAAKTDEISLECSRKVTGLSSGFSTTLEAIQEKHFVFLEAHSMTKKSLLLSIKVVVRPQSTLELL
jgi:hypothetical protein